MLPLCLGDCFHRPHFVGCCGCFFFSLNAGRKDDALTVVEGLRSKGMEVMDLSSNELAKASASAVCVYVCIYRVKVYCVWCMYCVMDA